MLKNNHLLVHNIGKLSLRKLILWHLAKKCSTNYRYLVRTFSAANSKAFSFHLQKFNLNFCFNHFLFFVVFRFSQESETLVLGFPALLFSNTFGVGSKNDTDPKKLAILLFLRHKKMVSDISYHYHYIF